MYDITLERVEEILKRIPRYKFGAEDAVEYFKKRQKHYKNVEAFLSKFNAAIMESIRRRRVYKTPTEIQETAHRLAENTKPYISKAKRKSTIRKPKKAKKNKWIPYDEQLQDPKWLEFREKIFRARGRRCEHCGSLEHLQVHHPKYIDGHKAWEYTINQVVVLCRDCHKKEHNITEEDSSDK